MKQLAIKAAREAGKILMRNLGRIKNIEKKEDKSSVTMWI